MNRIAGFLLDILFTAMYLADTLGRHSSDDEVTAEWRARWRTFALACLAALTAFGLVWFAASALNAISPTASPLRDVLSWMLMAPMLVATSGVVIASWRVWRFERSYLA